MENSVDKLEQLIQEIQESSKYRNISPDLIRRLGRHELTIRRNFKEAIKETKSTLHQIAGAFLDRKTSYDQWLSLFPAVLNGQDVKPICRDLMLNHASTRERLELLDTFYATTLEKIQPVTSVLDLCCGLNPLSLPWMLDLLTSDAAYYACDLYADMMGFLDAYLHRIEMEGRAWVCDVAGSPPAQQAQVALLLKALPPLEQTKRSDAISPLELLRRLNVDHILVSFPTRSLGGHSKGMATHYESQFMKLIANENWDVERFLFSNEICFLVTKTDSISALSLFPNKMQNNKTQTK